MRVLFTCGGTAGHINPAIGVAGRLRELMPDTEVLFIGAQGKMETELVPREGYDIRTIAISSLSRSLSFSGLKHNIRAAWHLATAMPAARKIIRDFKPDVVVGTGGYVCYPVLRQAAALGIPTAVHESNAMPGLTTRKLESVVDVIMVGFESAKANYKDVSRVRVTGTPVRVGFGQEDKASAKKALGLPADKPLLLSVWGSLGATEMNKTVAGLIGLSMTDPSFTLVHSAGKRGFDSMTAWMRDELGLSGWEEKGFEVRDYIYDMPRLMAAADLILCRSGASTLAELTAMGKPCILVPSPNVVGDHQMKNAMVLGEAGGAVVIAEKDATEERLHREVTRLLGNPARLESMGAAMRSLSVGRAVDEICGIVLELAEKK
ncbi:MAG: UDP-N-acetylglucosamine--N-acetylmuramyl-(pentapeptide) pyrophosphoryl-undecaprenol N-acetylglucosamine transferase [Oscillospiraceae bacterium]|nr:UDP-N-acetylglucosamine--N-acetylmuramyl-(pentapeptide) pyrophosphoryl-undecaprenol N-acetylglucosamine transferase [Oscillospiraceae bacterium]